MEHLNATKNVRLWVIEDKIHLPCTICSFRRIVEALRERAEGDAELIEERSPTSLLHLAIELQSPLTNQPTPSPQCGICNLVEPLGLPRTTANDEQGYRWDWQDGRSGSAHLRAQSAPP